MHYHREGERRRAVDTHRTVRVFRVGVGWRSTCRTCRWQGDPYPDIDMARADGRAHETQPESPDWSEVYRWLQR